MASSMCKAFVVAALTQTSASQMFDDCVAGTSKVWMPSPESGACFCGGDKPKMCQPYPEYLGLNRARCVKEDGDFAIGTASSTGMICGYFCLCENATVVDEKLTNVKCCRAGTKYGLKNHTVIAPEVASTTKSLQAEDFLPMPSNAFLKGAAMPLAFLGAVLA